MNRTKRKGGVHVDFRQIQYILAVAEHRNITKAAAALYISQPSLSHFIARTEEELGVKLFDRTMMPLKLTYAGEQYLKNAVEIMRVHDRMMREFRDIAGSLKGRLVVGIPHERAAYMLPLILPDFRRRHPGIEVDLAISNTAKIIDALARGRIDFGIGIFPQLNEFQSMEIYRERLLLVAAPGMVRSRHLLKKGNRALNPAKLGDLPFIISRHGHALFRRVSELWSTYNLSPQVVFESSSNITSLRLAAAGLGVTIVPAMTLKLAQTTAPPEVYEIGAPALTWTVALYSRKDAYVGAVERAFFETARQAFAGVSVRNVKFE